MNVGNGIHTIVVMAEFTDNGSAPPDTTSQGIISRRSLNVNVTNYLISQPPPP